MTKTITWRKGNLRWNEDVDDDDLDDDDDTQDNFVDGKREFNFPKDDDDVSKPSSFPVLHDGKEEGQEHWRRGCSWLRDIFKGSWRGNL